MRSVPDGVFAFSDWGVRRVFGYWEWWLAERERRGKAKNEEVDGMGNGHQLLPEGTIRKEQFIHSLFIST